jgi:hypothetical protein
MGATATFLKTLLAEGRMVVEVATPADPLALPILEEVFHLRSQEIAGPPIAFDRSAAMSAAEFVHRAAWHLLTREAMEVPLRMLLSPTTPSHHASADVVFRFLPTLQRRSRSLHPNDPLTETLTRTLREWPLSGVLTRGLDEPLTPPDFAHVGLAFLYAERLAKHESSGWFPRGDGLDAVEVVWRQLGRNPASLALRNPAPLIERKDDA